MYNVCHNAKWLPIQNPLDSDECASDARGHLEEPRTREQGVSISKINGRVNRQQEFICYAVQWNSFRHMNQTETVSTSCAPHGISSWTIPFASFGVVALVVNSWFEECTLPFINTLFLFLCFRHKFEVFDVIVNFERRSQRKWFHFLFIVLCCTFGKFQSTNLDMKPTIPYFLYGAQTCTSLVKIPEPIGSFKCWLRRSAFKGQLRFLDTWNDVMQSLREIHSSPPLVLL